MELIELAKNLNKKQKEKIEKKTRGSQPKLSVENKIILTLIYLRQGITFQVLGLLFQVNGWRRSVACVIRSVETFLYFDVNWYNRNRNMTGL